jgi:hypothetical protein
MSDITIATVSPLSGTPSVSVGGDLSVYSDFSCGGGLTLSSGNLTITGQSLFQSGFTSASLLTCNATPVSPNHLVTKSYIDELLNTNRVYYHSSAKLAASESMTLPPGNYTFYAEITGYVINAGGALPTVGASFNWGGIGNTITTTSQGGNIENYDSFIIPIKISNKDITAETTDNIRTNVSTSAGTVIQTSSMVYVIKNS